MSFHFECRCGITFPEALGGYGCPNCCGMNGRAILVEVKHAPVATNPYGCHNRKPIVTVCKPTCQYTYTALGQADERCLGCKERVA